MKIRMKIKAISIGGRRFLEEKINLMRPRKISQKVKKFISQMMALKTRKTLKKWKGI